MKESTRERIKLKATWLNGLAIAIFAVSGLAPFVTFKANTAAGIFYKAAVIVIGLASSYVVHTIASRTLLQLDELA